MSSQNGLALNIKNSMFQNMYTSIFNIIHFTLKSHLTIKLKGRGHSKPHTDVFN